MPRPASGYAPQGLDASSAPYDPQAHYATPPDPESGQLMTPTESSNAFATMTLPQDNSWYMDSGATSHMTNSSSNLMPLFSLSTPNHI